MIPKTTMSIESDTESVEQKTSGGENKEPSL